MKKTEMLYDVILKKLENETSYPAERAVERAIEHAYLRSVREERQLFEEHQEYVRRAEQSKEHLREREEITNKLEEAVLQIIKEEEAQ